MLILAVILTVGFAAGMLCRTRAEMEAALEKLQRMGLAEPTAPAPAAAAPAQTVKLPPADETPQYTARDLAERSKEDPRFAALVIEAQRALGHVLNTNDLKRLFSLYDYLALPPEVIMMLLNYCVKSRPTGNPPSMRQIEKEGYVWANREILTFEQAEKYIADSEYRREKLAQTARLLGITGRALSPTESSQVGLHERHSQELARKGPAYPSRRARQGRPGKARKREERTAARSRKAAGGSGQNLR